MYIDWEPGGKTPRPEWLTRRQIAIDTSTPADQLVVETTGLTKRYGERAAVDDLALRVRRGEVYGFVGPNGAGKTTTLRMLLGLIRPTSGRIVVAGRPPGDPAGVARVGAMIETPAFYPFLSGRDNLKVMALHAGLPERRIGQVLAEVDLTDRAGDRFSAYSLGMKQRLGVAAALLKDPELLILDEPTNGLDPAGMTEMRSLIRGLGREDRTVILSSHLMAEVEQVCDRVGVVRRGRLIIEGTVDELRGPAKLRLRATPGDRARACLERLEGVSGVATQGDRLVVDVDVRRAGEINRALVQSGIDVTELAEHQPGLEEIFLEITQDGDDRRDMEEAA